MERKGISLIGFPASGKSTIGKVVARMVDMPYLDIDRWIDEVEGRPLSEVIRERGAEYTLNLETKCIRGRDLRNTLVSTPGSIIYNDVYDHLSEQTEIVWLNVPTADLRSRLECDEEHMREVIGLKEKGFDKLYAERAPLYRKWAKYVIDCAGKDVDQIAGEIADTVQL